MLRAKRVYDKPERSDGTRVLVMRLWPRGIKKSSVDLWLKELGAEIGNLRAFKAGRIGWPEMRRRYLTGLRREPAASGLYVIVTRLADESLGERLLVRAGPRSLRIAAQFDPADHAAERGTRVDFTGDKATERPGLFRTTLNQFLSK